MYRNHPIWRCSQFKSMNSKGPWKTAKKTNYVADVYVVITEEIIVSNLKNVELTDALKPIIVFCMTRMKKRRQKSRRQE